jgi:hypothetical protein
MFSHIKELFSRPSGYTIARSVRLRSSASAYLNRTPASTTNRTIWTWSGWIKRGTLSTNQWFFAAGATAPTYTYTMMRFRSDDTLEFLNYITGGTEGNITTAQVFRDPSAWYHIVLTYDSTQATSTNRVKLYVNGSQVTSFSSGTYGTIYPPLNQVTMFNFASNTNYIGRTPPTDALYFDGYLTEVNFIDGQALTPSSFGSTNAVTGVWQPAKYTGTYGTNGFYLNFSDNSNNTATTIGKDYSGNGNNWTPNNISVTAGATYDSMIDTPTPYADGGNGRGNYCVLNPVNTVGSPTLSAGNLNATGSASQSSFSGTIGGNSGKYYAEFSPTAISGAVHFGAFALGGNSNGGNVGSGQDSRCIYRNDGAVFTSSQVATYASYTTSNIIGVAINLDASPPTAAFYKDNSLQGTVNLSTSFSNWTFAVLTNGSSDSGVVNFGQRPFIYTPPTGYVALNTFNLPDSTIKNGAGYMAATTYTGTGSSLTIANTVGSTSFQPDFVWVKSRSAATDHALYDSVRGTTKDLVSNSTAAETTQSTGLTAFGSTGFTVGALAKMNTSSATYVGWQWKAGGSSSSNTNGSITSTVSAGATQGFSVATYTGNGSAGATFGHGLGVAPNFVIIKERGNANGWLCYHSSTGNTGYLELDATLAFQTLSTVWNNTTPSSSVVTLGTVSNVNRNGGTFVAYCFAAVAGFSAFGSYTGNGSSDGPFVYLGFRPRFFMLKNITSAQSWSVQDTARSAYNVGSAVLQPNNSNAEATGTDLVDILSNGFKIRQSSAGNNNNNGDTYVYACFAENPFKNALAR